MAKKITKATAKKIIKFALAKKAMNVDLLDVRKITTVTDFFVICTGSTNVHVKAIVDSVVESCKKSGLEIYHIEGYDSLRWVLIDMVEIVIHVFQPDIRAYYQLERLWGDAPTEKFGYENEGVIENP